MKIAIMARTFDDSGGPGIANRNLVDEMIRLDHGNQFVVLHRTERHFGRYRDYRNVKEFLVRIPSKVLWDQVAVPYYCWKEGVDLILSPKFTVPLLTRVPTVVFCRGAEYYVFPEFYQWHDLAYVRAFLPLYYKKAARVLTLSDALQHDLNRYVNVPYEKMETIYSAPGDGFYPRTDRHELEAVRQKYSLPDEFVLSISFAYMGSKLYPRKNIDNVVKSFLALRREPSLKLVLAGREIHRYISTVFGREAADNPRLVYVGWIEQGDMPHLYSLASLLIFPSYSESFGLPLVEAMACGCPVVTSTGGACPEIVGDAGIVVDPRDTAGLTTAMTDILTSAELRQGLVAKGLKRAREFTWTQSAEKVIRILEEVYAAERRRPRE